MRREVTARSVTVLVALLGLVAWSCGRSPASPDGMTLGSDSLAPAAKGGPQKAAVCHFDETTGTWALLRVPASALQAHLAQHNDALPETATLSGTWLDASCLPVVCPCATVSQIVSVFSGTPDRTLLWSRNWVAAFIEDKIFANGPWYVESQQNYTPERGYYFQCAGPAIMSQAAWTTITEPQHNACLAAIRAAQAQLAVQLYPPPQ